MIRTARISPRPASIKAATPERSRWPLWVVALAAALTTAAASECIAWKYQLGPLDDAYISLRYAANWAHGRGLAFNPGERVEGYSNFLLVALEAGLIRSGVDPVLAMTLIGRVALAGLGALLAGFTFQHVFSRRALLGVIVGTLPGLNPMLVCWAHSGLEGCLHALLLLAALLAALATPSVGWAIVSALCMVLAAMTRLESVVVFPIVLGVLWFRSKSWRLAACHAGVLILGFGGYFVARAAYFGYLFPNTFYAKLDYGNAALARRGALYVLDFVLTSAPAVLLATAALPLLRRTPLWVRACFVLIGVQLLVNVYVGGDHFAMFRFLVPAVSMLTLAALYPAAFVIAKLSRPRLARGVAVAISIAAVGFSGVLVAHARVRGFPLPRSQLAGHQLGCRLAREWEKVGRWFKEHAPPDASIATVAIGAVGYFSDVQMVDPHGLVDPAIAHRPQALGQGISGHEKYDIAAVLSRRPAYILVVHFLTPIPVPRDRVAEAVWGEFSYRLASEPDLDRGYRYQTIQLDAQYLNLFIRRDLPPFRTPLGTSPAARPPQVGLPA